MWKRFEIDRFARKAGQKAPRTTKVIKLSCLSTVKAMDYIEGTRVNCVRSPAAELRSSPLEQKAWENDGNMMENED